MKRDSKYKTGLLSLMCLFALPGLLAAQDNKLTGIIKDADGLPLEGVQVVVKGTSQSVKTDEAGLFRVACTAQQHLSVKKDGYQMQNLRPRTMADTLKIVMEEAGEQALRIKKDWKRIMQERPVLIFDRNLMGEVPGVYTAFNGFTGNAGNILLRGITSVNLTSSPYILIDGLPVRQTRNLSPFASGISQSNINFIHPLDITNIEVVKDGYGGSFYGGRSGNGIINVNIDKGIDGSAEIEAMMRIGFSKADYDLDMMNATDFRAYLYDMMVSRGVAESELRNNIIFDPQHPKYNHSTDWMKEYERNGMFKDFQLKMKGGDGDTRYLFSVGYTGDNETLIESAQQRFNMRFNIDYKITPKIRISNFFSYNYETARFYDEGTQWEVNPVFLAATKAPFMSAYQYDDAGIWVDRLADADILGKSNPAVFKNNLKNKENGNRIDAVIKANWDITRQTSFNADFMVSYNSIIEKLHRKAQGIVPDRYIDRQNSKRSYSEYLMQLNLWLGQKGKVAERISYESRLGLSIEQYEEKMIYGRKVNAATDEIVSVDNGKLADSIANNRYEHHLMNIYLNGKMNLWDRLYLGANLNLERSSNFGPDGSWNFYAGADLNAFLLNNGHHVLAAYARWGRTGNHDMRGYYWCRMYKPTKYYFYGGIYLGNVENKDLKPEITDNYDAGLQIRLFDNLLSIEGGYYYKKTHGLLMQKALPIELGLDPQFENNGDVINQGIELAVNANILQHTSLKWSVYANFSTLKNEIKNLTNGEIVRTMDGFTGVARDGEEVGAFLGYKVKGVFKTASEVNLLRKDGTPYEAGDYIMEDVNKDGIINDVDRQVIGSPLPEFYGGFGTRLAYKGLTFAALFTYSYGNEVYNLLDQRLNSMMDYSNQTVKVLDRWLDESQPGKGFLPRAAYGDPSGNFSTSDRWVEDGSYLKLKSISLGYDVPLRNRSGFIKGLTLSVNCNNLLTVTGYKGFDPEIFSSVDPLLRGVDTGMSPNPRSFIFGVKIAL